MGWRHREVDVRGRLRGLDLSIQESRLQVYDVLSQGVVLRFYVFVVLLQFTKLADLLLQLLDITFLTLTKCALCKSTLATTNPRP